MNKKERNAGIVAGFSLLIMAIVAGFSYGYAHQNLVVDSPEITMQNLLTNKTLFVAEIVGWIIIFITDLIVSISLYIFFRKVSKQVSLISAVIRMVYTLILGIAIFQLIKIVPVLSNPNMLTNYSEIALHLQMFENFWSMGLIVFGLHLIGLGYLAGHSNHIPVWIVWLLFYAGFCYTLINGAKAVISSAAESIAYVEMILSVPMALAELGLAGLLIWKGLKK